ncbi:HdeD family acid-resistance protein [Kamptonema cortianum]|nr:HdeD family acid-resistance protein [Oscillatoria laete-virens]MDK3157168.1 HdeD family acid-resistance protein [Kamptonema cortianum]MDL5051144.1 HdeD family acid-resistance protein [Oscillatoria amoena NRMC-F 0135]MDL5055050.1 HdeD family acid-resistance protein [Oscillatoria laete-virens NRMC-F 0139]
MTAPTETQITALKNQFFDSLRQNARQAKLAGWIFIVLGVVAVIFPILATVVVELLVAWLILLSGLAQVVYALGHKGTKNFWVNIVFGLLSAVIGLIMAAMPTVGVVSLTSLMAAWFLVSGTCKFVAAWQIRPAPQWTFMLVNGLITVVLGYYIIFKFDSSVAWILGLFFGIDAIFGGWTLLSLVNQVEQEKNQ